MTGPSREDVDKIKWWHTIEFPNGVTSAGAKPKEQLESEAEAVFKYGVAGKSVMDVGAWNGYFTAAAFKHGASRVLAVDSPTWNHPGPANGFLGFELTRTYLAPHAETLNADIMDVTVDRVGQFDVILFLGVLYHLKHPLFVLERLSQIARERIVIETHLDAMNEQRPAGIFYPADECWGDHSNWWGFNIPAIEAMLSVAGFTRSEMIPYNGRDNRAFFHAWK